MKTYQFFGYGMLSDRLIIKTIIGRDPGVGTPAIVEGFQLAFQVLEQIPKGVREILERVWGPGFRAYTLREGPGIVAGIIWDMTEEEMIRLREWDFIGSWRELAETRARTSTGEMVMVVTEKVPQSQSIQETLNGLRYEENLNFKGQRVVAEQVRETELEQVREQLTTLRQYGIQAIA